MVDPAALREALKGYEISSSVRGVERERIFLAAARELLRRMETAETVWWCEEHNAQMDWSGSAAYPMACWRGVMKRKNNCRMVEAVLTRRDTEPFVNQQGLW